MICLCGVLLCLRYCFDFIVGCWFMFRFAD